MAYLCGFLVFNLVPAAVFLAKEKAEGIFLPSAFVFFELKETFGFAVRAPCSYFDDVFAVRVGCTDIKAVLPAIHIRLFKRVINMDDIISVVVLICAVFDHIVSFAFKNKFSTHFLYLR